MTVLHILRGRRATEIRLASEPAAVRPTDDGYLWAWKELTFFTHESAAFHLGAIAGNRDAVQCLRSLLASGRHDVFRMTDAQVIAAAAVLLSQRRLVCCEGTQAPLPLAPSTQVLLPALPRASRAAAPAPARAPVSGPSPVAAPAADPELEDMAQDAQAATLVAAARDGVPFCEVCEKAKQQAPAPEPEETTA